MSDVTAFSMTKLAVNLRSRMHPILNLLTQPYILCEFWKRLALSLWQAQRGGKSMMQKRSVPAYQRRRLPKPVSPASTTTSSSQPTSNHWQPDRRKSETPSAQIAQRDPSPAPLVRVPAAAVPSDSFHAEEASRFAPARSGPSRVARVAPRQSPRVRAGRLFSAR